MGNYIPNLTDIEGWKTFANYILSYLFESVAFKCIAALLIGYVAWQLVSYLYGIAVTPSGIHYVNLQRKPLPISSSYNPFTFDANYSTASYSGIECILKSERSCYVQAFWGVPIYPLCEMLGGDWQSLIHLVTSECYSQTFKSKCLSANDPFILTAGEEKRIEFKPLCDVRERIISSQVDPSRILYPITVLMVLKEEEEVVSESVVVAMASAVHIREEIPSLSNHLIVQYIKLKSGQLGRIKKIFLHSPATSEDDDQGISLCLVCYLRPVSLVFLPCRHACLCPVCFELCKKCPVCRQTSERYLELTDVPGRAD